MGVVLVTSAACEVKRRLQAIGRKGETALARSQVLDKMPLVGRNDLGALRLRTVATKDRTCAGFAYKISDGNYDPAVVLDLEYEVVMPTRKCRAAIEVV